MERDTTHVLTAYNVGAGRDIEPLLVESTGIGFASTAAVRGSDLATLELTGGGASSGRRLLGAGASGMSGYRMFDFRFDISVSMFWQITEYSCGFAATNPHIVPIRNQWVFALRPTAAAADALVATECVPPGDALPEDLELVPGANNVTDFDVAKEDILTGPGIGVAWLEGTQLFFGRAALNGGTRTATILNPMEVRGELGTKVRVAYNAMRQQWGVVTTSPTGSRLLILERNPDF